MLCKLLLFHYYHCLCTGAVAVGLAHYGQGNGPIVLDSVQCNGLEAYITDCSHNSYFTHDCIHAKDAGVQCLGMCVCGWGKGQSIVLLIR